MLYVIPPFVRPSVCCGEMSNASIIHNNNTIILYVTSQSPGAIASTEYVHGTEYGEIDLETSYGEITPPVQNATEKRVPYGTSFNTQQYGIRTSEQRSIPPNSDKEP